MAITETPVRYSKNLNGVIVKEEQPKWYEQLLDFATGVVHGLEDQEQITPTSTFVATQQGLLQENQQIKNVLLMGGLILVGVLIIQKI